MRHGPHDAETGGVTVERYMVAYDIGRAVNPMILLWLKAMSRNIRHF